jgi:hypothetical protein
MYIVGGDTPNTDNHFPFLQMPDIGISYNRQFSNKVSEAVGGELHSFNPHTGKKVWNISLTNISSTFKTYLQNHRDLVNYTRDPFVFYDSLNLTAVTTLSGSEPDEVYPSIEVMAMASASGISQFDYLRLTSKWGEDVYVSSISSNDVTVVRDMGNSAINGGNSAHSGGATVYRLGRHNVRYVSGLQFQEISIGRYSTSFVIKEVAPS